MRKRGRGERDDGTGFTGRTNEEECAAHKGGTAEDGKSAAKSRRRSTVREFSINRHAEGVEPSQGQAQIGTLRITHRTAEATSRVGDGGEGRDRGREGGRGTLEDAEEKGNVDARVMNWVAMRKAGRGDKQRRVDYGNVVPAMRWMSAVESEKTRLDIVSTRTTDEETGEWEWLSYHVDPKTEGVKVAAKAPAHCVRRASRSKCRAAAESDVTDGLKHGDGGAEGRHVSARAYGAQDTVLDTICPDR
ncbi:hypothetical protein C8R45DRAFT_935823 [Mycena sanguinolenta]|nr:hypothetical protein C8R45DRAFT_935823 [Mycena sanguinolenta]